MASLDPRTAAAGGVLPKIKTTIFNPSEVKHATLYIAFQDTYRKDTGPDDLLPIEDRLVVRAIFPAFKKIATQQTGLLIARNLAAIYYFNPEETTFDGALQNLIVETAQDKPDRFNLRRYTAYLTNHIISNICDPKVTDVSSNPKLQSLTGLPLEIFNMVWVDIVQPQIDAKGKLPSAQLRDKANELITKYAAKLGVTGVSLLGGARTKRTRKSKSPRRRSSPGKARSTHRRYASPARGVRRSRTRSRSRSRSPYRKSR